VLTSAILSQAADNVLLAALRDAPPSAELIRRLAVYRQSVDQAGTTWPLSEVTSVPDPLTELVSLLEQVQTTLDQARQAGTAASAETWPA
jgi:hypothetical protein